MSDEARGVAGKLDQATAWARLDVTQALHVFFRENARLLSSCPRSLTHRLLCSGLPHVNARWTPYENTTLTYLHGPDAWFAALGAF
jgi:hypothetical protein